MKIKMISWAVLFILITTVFAFLDASPFPQSDFGDFEEYNDQVDDSFRNKLARNRRQNYYYDYPFANPYDYYKAPAYPDYYNPYYQPSYFNLQPNRKPFGYNTSKKSHRRKGNPFEPTTQKYTVWDLARK